MMGRPIRLQGYDYSRGGAYFVTICVQNRECLLGDIVDDEMRLNHAARMVERWWAELGNKFPSVETDEYVVMPNHFHGIIVLVGADLCVRPYSKGTHAGVPLHRNTTRPPQIGRTRRCAPTAASPCASRRVPGSWATRPGRPRPARRPYTCRRGTAAAPGRYRTGCRRCPDRASEPCPPSQRRASSR